ncbi:DUF6259 domain-containing protein [Candidatus Latescibacterota bacterium]
MKRRDLLKKVGKTAAIAQMATFHAEIKTVSANQTVSKVAGKETFIRVENNKVFAETKTLSAIIDKGFITSMKSKITGEDFIKGFDVNKSAALQLIYFSDETVRIDEEKFGSITSRRISDLKAEIIFQSWDGDGVIFISVDPETGDLLVEPSAYSSRPGVRACRWCIRGLREDLKLVAPLFQGINLALNDPLLRDSRWEWPMYWEAGFAILQSSDSGLWVHTRDNRYKYKALKTGFGSDPFGIGLDSEAYGPVDTNLSAGGLCWRINVFRGDWHIPAEQYRKWYWSAYDLESQERRRQQKIYDVKFAISWCPDNPDILDALAKRLPPENVLLHFPNWRTDAYDENYPTYVASNIGKAFIDKSNDMGFLIMPHFNSIDMDPSNSVYTRIRDFQYRNIEKKQLLGWSWYKSRVIGVPESNLNRINNRDKKVMIKVHPGLGMWRSILGERILHSSEELSLDTVFIDVTLVTHNLYNCLVESKTSSEGMNLLINYMGDLGKGLVIGGEGLNEITAQGLSFGQVHLFKSWHDSLDGLERTGGCNLNEVLFGKLCRTFGYSGLGGNDENEELRMKIHLDHGAIPTVTIRSAEDITNPNPAVKKMLDIASS